MQHAISFLLMGSIIAVSCDAPGGARSDQASRDKHAVRDLPQVAPPPGAFDVAVSFRQERYSAAAEVELLVTVKNTTEHIIGFYSGGPERDWYFVLRDEEGHEMPPTRYNREIVQPLQASKIYPSQRIVSLRPGQAVSYTFVLSRLYDLTMPGKYRLTAEREVLYRQNGKAEPARITAKAAEVIIDDRPNIVGHVHDQMGAVN